MATETDASRPPKAVLRAPTRMAHALRRRAQRWWIDGAAPDRQWIRTVMLDDMTGFLRALPVADLEACECSSDTHAALGWKRHERLVYPGFDLTDPPANADRYDVVLCEQVLEHVTDPWKATQTLFDLCRPGGYVVVSTPFLVKVHEAPGDYWRFTVDGLRILLTSAGLEVVRVESWGNRAAVRASLWRWSAQRPWRSLRNVDTVPVVVWAFARRPAET